jgi:hypothetical protein
MPRGPLMLESVLLETVPLVVMRPIELLLKFMNHKAPSGPLTMYSSSEMPTPVEFVMVTSDEATAAETGSSAAKHVAIASTTQKCRPVATSGRRRAAYLRPPKTRYEMTLVAQRS